MFQRLIENRILNQLDQPEVVMINGPRRVGKTTLLHVLADKITPRKNIYFDFTDPNIQQLWKNYSEIGIKTILSDLKMEKDGVIFMDEIQYFDGIGILLKLFYDHFPHIKIIASGSSSFLFMHNIGDSLAGRKKIYSLFPLSLAEIEKTTSDDYWQFKEKPYFAISLMENVKRSLLFGSYPEIVTINDSQGKIDKLKEMVDSYLFKDLLMIEGVKKPRIILELTKLLAYQIGQMVNPNEIAQTLGIARETLLNYIDLLEKFFIVFKVYPYERNLRDVIKKKFKVYFYDLGIRNGTINNFNPLEQREDKGFLLENAVMLGFKRRISYDNKLTEIYFWRNYEGKEIDCILKDQKTSAFEIKWEKKRFHLPKLPVDYGEIIDLNNSYRFML